MTLNNGSSPASANGAARKLRSRAWFDNPDNPDMTALYLERYLNFGISREELLFPEKDVLRCPARALGPERLFTFTRLCHGELTKQAQADDHEEQAAREAPREAPEGRREGCRRGEAGCCHAQEEEGNGSGEGLTSCSIL